MPKSKASRAPVPMHPILAGFLLAWRERTSFGKDGDFVFPSFRLKGKKPLSASITSIARATMVSTLCYKSLGYGASHETWHSSEFLASKDTPRC